MGPVAVPAPRGADGGGGVCRRRRPLLFFTALAVTWPAARGAAYPEPLETIEEPTAAQGPVRHGLMIDAGSQGSRLWIFRWRAYAKEEIGRTIILPEAVGNKTTVPGIGSFALVPEMAGESLAPLMEHACKALADFKDRWQYIPVWLRATAGMRLLHADEREAVLNNVRKFLRNQPFYFRNEHALVITGEEEGVYGWLTVNSMMGNFKLANNERITWRNTVGSMDLGGASTQIVFIPMKSIMAHAFPIQLGTHRFRVYTWSFLHFGQREAAHRSADVIISNALQQVQSIDELQHPCYSIGYVYTPKFEYSDNRTFPMTVAMQGSSDFRSCARLIRKTFQKRAPCLVQSCSFYGVYQPHVYASRFVAFSHFAEVAKNLALPTAPTLRDLKVASEYVCSLSLDQLNVVFGRVKNDYDRLHLCSHSAYIYTLLTYGYGFRPDSSQIIFQSKDSSGAKIDYIVGAMIYEINQDPWLVEKNETAYRLARMASREPAQAAVAPAPQPRLRGRPPNAPTSVPAAPPPPAAVPAPPPPPAGAPAQLPPPPALAARRPPAEKQPPLLFE